MNQLQMSDMGYPNHRFTFTFVVPWRPGKYVYGYVPLIHRSHLSVERVQMPLFQSFISASGRQPSSCSTSPFQQAAASHRPSSLQPASQPTTASHASQPASIDESMMAGNWIRAKVSIGATICFVTMAPGPKHPCHGIFGDL